MTEHTEGGLQVVLTLQRATADDGTPYAVLTTVIDGECLSVTTVPVAACRFGAAANVLGTEAARMVKAFVAAVAEGPHTHRIGGPK